MKLKVHHILLSVVGFFIIGMVATTLIKKASKEYNRIKSDISDKQLLEMVSTNAKDYLTEKLPELDLNKVTKADIYLFKNKREISLVLITDDQVEGSTSQAHSVGAPVSFEDTSYLLNLEFKNLSPGFGLRHKVYELTPPEGIYTADYAGYKKRGGFFVRVLYPPDNYKDNQRLDFDKLKLDPFLISEKAISNCFIQADKDFMNLFVYLILKLGPENIKILIYPDRPPLEMELGGTEAVSEIYLQLDNEYKKLEVLQEKLKTKSRM